MGKNTKPNYLESLILGHINVHITAAAVAAAVLLLVLLT